jgi:hypothetical protein
VAYGIKGMYRYMQFQSTKLGLIVTPGFSPKNFTEAGCKFTGQFSIDT